MGKKADNKAANVAPVRVKKDKNLKRTTRGTRRPIRVLPKIHELGSGRGHRASLGTSKSRPFGVKPEGDATCGKPTARRPKTLMKSAMT